MKTHDQLKKEMLRDPEVRAEYDRLRDASFRQAVEVLLHGGIEILDGLHLLLWRPLGAGVLVEPQELEAVRNATLRTCTRIRAAIVWRNEHGPQLPRRRYNQALRTLGAIMAHNARPWTDTTTPGTTYARLIKNLLRHIERQLGTIEKLKATLENAPETRLTNNDEPENRS